MESVILFRKQSKLADRLLAIIGILLGFASSVVIAEPPTNVRRYYHPWPAGTKVPAGAVVTNPGQPVAAIHRIPKRQRDAISSAAVTATGEPTEASDEVTQASFVDGIPSELVAPDSYTAHSHTAHSYTADSYAADSYAADGPIMSSGKLPFPMDYGTPSVLHPNLQAGMLPLWVRAESITWWGKGVDVPALITTSPNGTAQAIAGVLGRNTTGILFGGQERLDDHRSGGRFTIGLWLDGCQATGIDFVYTMLEDQSHAFASDPTMPIVARPFFDIQANAEDSRLIAFPGLVDGTVDAEISTAFRSFETRWHRCLRSDCLSTSDFQLGYRYANLEDSIDIHEVTTSLSGATQGSNFVLFDRFRTENQFHGVQLGLRYELIPQGCWGMEFYGSVALGNTSSRIMVNGQTATTTAAGGQSSAPAGLLALNSNSGTFEQDEFGTLTETGLKLRGPLWGRLMGTIGYNFLFWSDVARAVDQIDRNINPSQIPPGTLIGQAAPVALLATDGYWLHGITAGLEYQF